jgi:hypothetical protein
MSKVNYTFDHLARSLDYHSQDNALMLNLNGFNHFNKRNIMPMSKNLQGFTFFVRPQLNMSQENLRQHRLLLSLVNSSPMSVGTYIRTMLDPRLMSKTSSAASKGAGTTSPRSVSNQYVNNKQAFIPILTNSLKTLSGWPDIETPTWSGKPGLYKETYTMVDGSADIRNQIELNASFRNSAGEVIMNMFHAWAMYSAAVFEGKVVPYPDFMVENELDYNTRIFRILLDRKGRSVVKIAATGPGIIQAVGIGAGYDFNADTPYNESQADIDFRFKCQGVEYQDPVLLYEFNETVAIFNPAMKSTNEAKQYTGVSDSMYKVPELLLGIFNYEGYPHINLLTGEFEIYVDKSVGESVKREFEQSGLFPSIPRLIDANNESENPLQVQQEAKNMNANIYSPGIIEPDNGIY